MTPNPRESSRSREAQWVVARRPWRRPALPRRSAPVQTEVTCRALAAVARIQSRVSSSWRRAGCRSRRGPRRRSIGGASAKRSWGTTTSPPVAVTGSGVLATVKTRKGALSSERRDSTPGPGGCARTLRTGRRSPGPRRCRRSGFPTGSDPWHLLPRFGGDDIAGAGGPGFRSALRLSRSVRRLMSAGPFLRQARVRLPATGSACSSIQRVRARRRARWSRGSEKHDVGPAAGLADPRGTFPVVNA